MRLLLDDLRTPIGTMLVVTNESGALCALTFEDRRARSDRQLAQRFGTFSLVRSRNPGSHTSRLRAYFEGDLAAFEGARLDLGGTEFQRAVWSALRRIAPGTTASYGEIARMIGRRAAVRAVGAANGANPVAIVVPCHRIIGANGSLTGYGGGLERKRFLLAHEAAAATRASEARRSRSDRRARMREWPARVNA